MSCSAREVGVDSVDLGSQAFGPCLRRQGVRGGADDPDVVVGGVLHQVTGVEPAVQAYRCGRGQVFVRAISSPAIFSWNRSGQSSAVGRAERRASW
ncbi:hypothetical protein [Streptomyces formicae]